MLEWARLAGDFPGSDLGRERVRELTDARQITGIRVHPPELVVGLYPRERLRTPRAVFSVKAQLGEEDSMSTSRFDGITAMIKDVLTT